MYSLVAAIYIYMFTINTILEKKMWQYLCFSLSLSLFFFFLAPHGFE